MSQYLEHLEKAFNDVPPFYRQCEVQRHAPYYIQDQGIERTFMCELYHRWKVVIYKNLGDYQGLYLQATIGKKITPDKDVEFPDLVLHQGQSGDPTNGNVLFVEIKMDSYDKDDVSKIFRGLENLNYNYGVYIISNSSKQKILESINKNYIRDFQTHYEYFKQFYFLTYKDGLMSLNELLENKTTL